MRFANASINPNMQSSPNHFSELDDDELSFGTYGELDFGSGVSDDDDFDLSRVGIAIAQSGTQQQYMGLCCEIWPFRICIFYICGFACAYTWRPWLAHFGWHNLPPPTLLSYRLFGLACSPFSRSRLLGWKQIAFTHNFPRESLSWSLASMF